MKGGVDLGDLVGTLRVVDDRGFRARVANHVGEFAGAVGGVGGNHDESHSQARDVARHEIGRTLRRDQNPVTG